MRHRIATALLLSTGCFVDSNGSEGSADDGGTTALGGSETAGSSGPTFTSSSVGSATVGPPTTDVTADTSTDTSTGDSSETSGGPEPPNCNCPDEVWFCESFEGGVQSENWVYEASDGESSPEHAGPGDAPCGKSVLETSVKLGVDWMTATAMHTDPLSSAQLIARFQVRVAAACLSDEPVRIAEVAFAAPDPPIRVHLSATQSSVGLLLDAAGSPYSPDADLGEPIVDQWHEVEIEVDVSNGVARTVRVSLGGVQHPVVEGPSTVQTLETLFPLLALGPRHWLQKVFGQGCMIEYDQVVFGPSP